MRLLGTSVGEGIYDIEYFQQCLILVNFDVDAICASKILQALFKNDNVVYTLVPIQGVKDMVKAYQENAEEVTRLFISAR